MFSSPKNNQDNKKISTETYRAFFKKGSQSFYISNNSFGFASWPGRYSQAAVDLDRFLKEPGMDGTNGRIGFASWANSEEEFVFYLNHFFDLQFFTEKEFLE